MDERIQPAIYSKVADLTLEVWHVPLNADGTVGEPVPFEKARNQSYAPARVGDRWGPAWGTSWFHVTGSVPADVEHPEVRFDLGWATRRPGMQAEALVFTPDGGAREGPEPPQQLDPGPARPADRVVRRSRGQPGPQRLPAHGPRGQPHLHQRAALHGLPGRGGPSASGGVRARCRRRRPQGADARPPDRGRSADGDRLRPRTGDGRPRRPGRARHRRRRPRRAGRRTQQAGARQRSPGLRCRPCPHRLGLAVAGARDRPQGRADRCQRRSPERFWGETDTPSSGAGEVRTHLADVLDQGRAPRLGRRARSTSRTADRRSPGTPLYRRPFRSPPGSPGTLPVVETLHRKTWPAVVVWPA